MKSAIAFTIAVLAAGAANADNTANVQSTMRANALSSLPYSHVADYASKPGETLHAFLLRVAPDFRAYADATGYEACAAIARSADGASFGLVVGSNQSHLGCAIDPSRVPAGMITTGESIHTHGREKKTFILNDIDLRLLGMSNPGGHPIRFTGEDVNHFSQTDYDAPGYLATPDGLIYQHGAGTVVDVAR